MKRITTIEIIKIFIICLLVITKHFTLKWDYETLCYSRQQA